MHMGAVFYDCIIFSIICQRMGELQNPEYHGLLEKDFHKQ